MSDLSSSFERGCCLDGFTDVGTTPSGSGLSPTVEPASSLDDSATSIPSARARVISRREIIRGVPGQWRSTYCHGSRAYDPEKRAIQAKLDALDLETVTPEEVALVIGNKSWTANICDVCGRDSELIVQIGDEPDYDMRWIDICLPCLAGFGEWAAQAMSAGTAETEGLRAKPASAVVEDHAPGE